MNYVALRNEIATGPLAAECAGKSDTEIADILNEPRYQRVASRFVTARTILAEIPGGAAILDKLEATAAVSSLVKWAVVFLKQDSGLDIGHPNTQAQIDALMAASVLSSAEGIALKNMALSPASRAEIAGLGSATANDCGTALRGI